MGCAIKIKANGKDSELQVKLAKALNSETRAENYMAIISGEDFKEKFGDWEAAGISGELTTDMESRMENLEPQLHRKKGTNQYYFELPGGTKFFVNRKKIADIPSEYHAEIIRTLSKHFLSSLKDQNNNIDKVSPEEVSSSIEKTISDYLYSIENSKLSQEYKDRFKANAEMILKYKDDFVREVIIFSEDLTGSYAAREYQGTIEEEDTTEEDRSNNLGIGDSFEVNPMNSASANIKIMLSQVEDVYSDGSPKDGEYLGLTTFIELNEVYKTLLPALSDVVGHGNGDFVVDVFDKMKDRLKTIKGVRWMDSFINKLDSMSEDRKTEFVQAFSMTKINFYATEVDGKSYKILNATSTNSRESQIVSRWGNKFQNDFIEDGKISEEKIEEIKELQIQMKTAYRDYANEYRDAKDDVNEQSVANDNAMESLLEILYSVGVFTEIDGVSGPVTLDFTDVFFEINGGVEKNAENVRALYDSTKRILSDIIKNKNSIISKQGVFNNPIASQKNIKNLAQAIGVMDTDIADSNILANGGKSYYTYSNPTYISNKLNEWKEDIRSKSEDFTVPTSLEEMSKDEYTDNSVWRQYFAATDISNPSKRRQKSLERIEEFEQGLASTFKSRGLNDGSDNKDIDYIDAVNDSLTKILGQAIGEKSYFPTLVPADKSRKVEFTGPKMIESGIQTVAQTGEVYIPNKTIKIFSNYFLDEYNRMKKVAREISSLPENELVQHYHIGNKNGLKSQLFPDFSFDSTSDKYKALRRSLYDSNGNPITTSKGMSESQISLLEEAVKDTLVLRVNKTMLEINDIPNKNKKLVDHYNRNYNNGTVAMAGDYLVNGLVSTVEFAKMFSGDPAYYKNPIDLIKRIPATYTDGQYLRLSDKDSLVFNHAVIKGVEVKSRYVDKIKESLTDKSIADAYESVNTSDAQAWITPRRWKFIKQRLGQWGPLHRSAFAAMESGRKMSAAELKVAAQPLKGVYFEINDGRPVYLKYSQAVLLPNLVKGTPMEAVYNKMVGDTQYDPKTKKTTYAREAKDEIHEVITEDGVKVGAVAPTRINVDGTTELDTNFELNSVELSNRGWKLQQDLPIKKIHETNLGSQVQRTILSGMVMSGTYEVNGQSVSGKDLLNMFHEKVKELSDAGKERLTAKFSIVDGKIQDMGALYDALIKDLRSTGGNDNIIAALEKETDFEAVPQIKNKVQSLFMSMMNKEVIKISTNGGSFIQVSPFALESTDDKNVDGIKIVSKNYDGKGLQPPRMAADGKTVLPGQIMMPHTDAAKLLKSLGLDITKMTGEEIMEKLDPSALEVIGYRIPNQGMSSNDYLEIVGILPEGMGDSMLVYDAIPGKTGSDFDIDKMFLMMNNLEVVNGKITKVQDANSLQYKQNEMIDLYRAVLSSPLTYDAMMTSIDSSSLKNDITDLFPTPEAGNLELFSPVEQIKTKFDYSSGAAGLGSVANQLVDHVAGQSLNLYLPFYLGKGTFATNSKGDSFTTFDKLEGNTIANTLSSFLNAYVDIAKDPYISRGNYNSITSPVALMLVRAGYDVKWVNRFIGQPILQDLVKLTQDSQGKTAEPLLYNKRKVKPIEYLALTRNLDLSLKDVITLNENNMESEIVSAREDGFSGNKDMSGAVLGTFEIFQEAAKELTNSILASKAPTNGAGGSALDLLLSSNKIAMAETGIIKGFKSKFKNTALGAYNENSIEWIGEVLDKSDLFFTSDKKSMKTFNYINRRAGKGQYIINKEFARALDKSLYSYVASGTELFTSPGSRKEELDFLLNGLPSILKDMRENNVRENFLLKELQFNKSKDGYEFVTIDSKNKPKHYQNKIYSDWLSLYESKENKQVAVDLVKYSFATSGFANNLGQFFTHIPHEILQDLGFARDIVKFKKNIDEISVDNSFLDQFLRNNSDNPSIVDRVSFNQNDIVEYKKYSKDVAFSVLLDEDHDTDSSVPFLTTKNKKGEIILYKLVDETIDNGAVYVREPKLGYKSFKGSVVEYAKDEKIEGSSLKENSLDDKIQEKVNQVYLDVGTQMGDPDAFIKRIVTKEEKTKLEYGDLFGRKDVSLSNEEIIKKNLDDIIKMNNIKGNKDC